MTGVSTLDPRSTPDIVRGSGALNAGPSQHNGDADPPAVSHATGHHPVTASRPARRVAPERIA